MVVEAFLKVCGFPSTLALTLSLEVKTLLKSAPPGPPPPTLANLVFTLGAFWKRKKLTFPTRIRINDHRREKLLEKSRAETNRQSDGLVS